MKKRKLTFEELHQLIQYIRQEYPESVIAKYLDRHRSSIYRAVKRLRELELRQPEMRNAESLVVARRLHDEKVERRTNARNQRMRLKSKEIQAYVEWGLRRSWTTIAIAGRLPIDKPGASITPEAIYQWINSERPELKEYLPIAGKSRKRRKAGRKNRKPRPVSVPKKSIEIRPVVANMRQRIGDLELDAILSCRTSKSALQVLVDRKSRKVFLKKVDNLESENYIKTLSYRIHCDIPVIHSMTSDNGTEHAQFHQIESSLDIEWFFCHPYCSSERGTVENRNRAIRKFFPKGTNFDEIPDEYITFVEDYINNYPLAVLDFSTPNEIWNLELENINKAKLAA